MTGTPTGPAGGAGAAGRGEVALRRTGSRARANEWALVLAAKGLRPRVHSEPGAFVLALPGSQLERGDAELAAYERENPPREREPAADAAPVPRPSRAGTLAAAALLLFFLVTGPPAPGSAWFEAGRADAERILAGEPWRAVTALTLHADALHVLGNAVLGAIVVNAVCGALGPGVGIAAVLLAGVGGNGINALAHTASHRSVGASTAVFGAVGLLLAPALARRRRGGLRGRRWLAPVGAGLGLVAMLGVAGERTDLWAHLFGFATGPLLGVPGAVLARRRPGPAVQVACGAGAAAGALASWGLALLR